MPDSTPAIRPQVPTRRYRRDKTGGTVHRANCRTLAGRGQPWNFADGMDGTDVELVILAHGWLRACKTCCPTSNAPDGLPLKAVQS